MKNWKFFIFSVIATAITAFSICGCSASSGTDDEAKTFTVSYYYNGSKIFTQIVRENLCATPPDVASHKFLDESSWLFEGEKFDFSTPIKADTALSADLSITYTVEFYADGECVHREGYSPLYNKDAYIPAVPEKFGYTARWNDFALTGGYVRVDAVYTPVDYEITFYAGGKYVDAVICTVENFSKKVPPVPHKSGYYGSWVYRNDCGRLVAEAEYELIDIPVDFYADGKLVYTVITNAENIDTCYPEIPSALQKEHYDAEWEEFVFTGGPVTVNLVYTPIVYTVKFVAENYIFDLEYTIEDVDLAPPSVPVKAHYTGAWEEFAFDFADKTVTAVYEPIVYTIRFIADGKTVAAVPYTVLDTQIQTPDVPEKYGYSAKWSEFTLSGGDMTVTAEYELLAPTAGLTYEISKEGDCAVVTGYGGGEDTVIIASEYLGLPVTHIAESAFYQSAVLERVMLPECLKSIGEYAFAFSGLREIVMPDGVEEILSGAFYSCANLVYAELGDSLQTVEDSVFAGCRSLRRVKFGKSLKAIDPYAFFLCENLASAEFYDTAGWKTDPLYYQDDLSAKLRQSPEAAAEVILFCVENYKLYREIGG